MRTGADIPARLIASLSAWRTSSQVRILIELLIWENQGPAGSVADHVLLGSERDADAKRIRKNQDTAAGRAPSEQVRTKDEHYATNRLKF